MAKDIPDFLIPIDEGNLNPQIKVLFDAMKELKHSPHKITDVKSINNRIIERNYVCSIIYQLGKLSNSRYFPFSDSILIGGDMNKYIEANKTAIRVTGENLEFSFNGDRFEVIPDLIIHGSHNRDSIHGNEQFVAVEVKSTDYLGIVAFEKDFFKLNAYLTCLNYQHAIYVIVNSDKETINIRIKQYVDNNFFVISERLGDLYFFIQDSIYAEPIAYRIDDAKYEEERKKVETK